MPTANLTYLCLFFTTTGYALLLESLRRDPERSYAPRWTWLTVVIGVSLVGGFAALHLWALPLVPVVGRWDVWWIVAWHFVAGGAPIIAWQEIVDRRDVQAALNRQATRRNWPTTRTGG